MVQATSSKFPLALACVLSYVCFSQAVLFTAPFTLSVYMVKDFLTSDTILDERTVGQWAGLLSASFSFAQVLTAWPLGKASDRVGRKIIFTMGNISSFISIIWFGLASSYGWAVASRVYGGLFNFIPGAWKCIIAESMTPGVQAQVFGYMNLAWGLGAILGPMVGGLCARPCDNFSSFPSCGDQGIFRVRPYFFACLVVAVFLLLATLLTIFFLEETLPSLRSKRQAGGTASSTTALVIDGEVQISVEAPLLDERDHGMDLPVEPWYRDRQVVLALSGYTLISLIYCIIDEVLPMYASAALVLGGLGMKEAELARPLMFYGLVLMLFSVWGFPRLQRWQGTLRATHWGLATAVVTCVLLPLVNYPAVAGHWELAQVILYTSMAVKGFSQCSALTGSIILVQLVTHKTQLGSVNGVGQMAASLVRGIGPALGGIVWGLSMTLNMKGQQFTTFALSAAISAICMLVYARLQFPQESERGRVAAAGD